MNEIQYTQERTADNGEIIKARLTQTENGYLIEILANGMAIINETFEASNNEGRARGLAHIAATAYVFKLNNPNYGVIEESTDVLAAVETMIADIATDEPAAVDRGGDIEAVAEMVNAPEPTSKTVLEGYTNASKKVQAGVEPEDGGFYVFVTVDGLIVEGGNFEDKQDATEQAQTWFNTYSTTSENPRIKQLRARIASQERELIDLRFELSQLVGDAWQIDGKHHCAYFDGKDWIVMLRRPFSSNDAVMGKCTTRAYAEVEVSRLDAEREREEIDTAEKVRSFLRQRGTE